MQLSHSRHPWLEKKANYGEGKNDTLGEVHAAPRLARVERRLTGGVALSQKHLKN